jgi:hypothetical protein
VITITLTIIEGGTLTITAKDVTAGSAGCTETRSVLKAQRQLTDVAIAEMHSKALARMQASVGMKAALAAREAVVRILQRCKRLYEEVIKETAGAPKSAEAVSLPLRNLQQVSSARIVRCWGIRSSSQPQ